jgi:hypothetical protein
MLVEFPHNYRQQSASHLFGALQGAAVSSADRAARKPQRSAGDTQVVTVRMSRDLHAAIMNAASDQNISLNKWCLAVMMQGLEAQIDSREAND